MKVSDATILMLGGDDARDDDHWLGRWGKRLSTARTLAPDEPLSEAMREARSPIVVVAHKDGVERLLKIADEAPVRGAFLVAPRGGRPMEERDDPLPFPSILVASRDDPDCSYGAAEGMGARWGSEVLDAGAAGGLDAASGHGPWPEGLMVFAKFLSNLPRDS